MHSIASFHYEPKIFTSSDKSQLDRAHSIQLELRRWLEARKDLRADEQAALCLSTAHACVEFWSAKCSHEEISLAQSRQRGWKKWTHKYQMFGAGVMGFMRDWEPLISVIKRAGGTYGELLFGTMSVLFVIAEYKQNSEGYLSTALSDIRDAMIGFALYKDIFDGEDAIEDDLRNKMIEAYCEFAKLIVEGIRYYRSGSKGRLFKAFREPMRFEETVETVKTLIARIRMRCDDLMYRDISQIKQSNIDLTIKLNELHHVFDSERLSRVLDRWHLRPLSTEQRSHELTRHYQHLKHEIDDDVERFFSSTCDRKRAAFESSAVFTKWKNSDTSALFLLIGYQEYSIATQQHYCWVSPIILDFVRQQENAGSVFAYHLLPTKGSVGLCDVVLSLLSQLLPYQAMTLRNESIVRSLNQLYSSVVASTHDWELDAALEKLSLYVIDELFPISARITLLLDRLDRLDPRESDDRTALLRILAKVARTAGCTVKIFVVASGSDWRFDVGDVREFEDVVVVRREKQERLNDEDDY